MSDLLFRFYHLSLGCICTYVHLFRLDKAGC